jgi:hypothetical protein
MKRLSFEGLFESGALELAQGKVCAFVAVHDAEHGGVQLGLAVANERGYYPVPAYWVHGDDHEYAAMQEHARALNREHFKLDDRAAALVVASTMGGPRTYPRT